MRQQYKNIRQNNVSLRTVTYVLPTMWFANCTQGGQKCTYCLTWDIGKSWGTRIWKQRAEDKTASSYKCFNGFYCHWFASNGELIRLYASFPSYEAFLSFLSFWDLLCMNWNTGERKIMKESNNVNKFPGSFLFDDEEAQTESTVHTVTRIWVSFWYIRNH